MKIFYFFFLMSFVLLSCKSSPKLEKMSDKEYVKRAVKNEFPSPDSIIIKDIVGNIITKDDMISMYEQGGMTSDFYQNNKGEIVEVVVRRSTTEDQKLEAEINRKLNAGPPVTIIDIDCENVNNLLEEAYRRDVEIRQVGATLNPQIDRHNLELVVSIDELCGLPEGKEYQRQIFIVWLIIQHNSAQYRKKYLNYLTKAAKEGSLEEGQLALMKDRILMDDGKPQIYGSQILDGKLYNLRDASTVDKRRAEVGLGPLKEYLEQLGVAFMVPQE